MNGSNDFRYVVAIDFGTSRSGYAWARRGVDDQIHLPLNWPGLPVGYPKTYTHLFYSPDKEASWWGAEALNERVRRSDCGEPEGFFFDTFKMDLFDPGRSDYKVLLDPHHGPYRTVFHNYIEHKFYAIDLIAEYLRRLKERAMSDLSEKTAGNVDEAAVRWILTIPASARDNQKRLMRKAALKAELIKADAADHDRLILALEPEAAALYCNQQAPELSTITSGYTLVVVDCGGGTVDVTAHRFDPDSCEFTQLAAGKAVNAGSTYLDRAFIAYLERLFGLETLAKYKMADGAGFKEIITKNWETAKCGLRVSDQSLFLDLGGLVDFLRDREPRVWEKCKELLSRSRKLKISTEVFLTEIANPVFDSASKAVDSVMDEIPGRVCDAMYVVGGLSNSEHLRASLRERFAQRLRHFVTPAAPEAAVLRGAVLFGLHPERIVRRVRWTYGIESRLFFQPGVHHPSRKVRAHYDDSDMIERGFNVLIVAGELVPRNHVVRTTVYPVHPDQTSMLIRIIATGRRTPLYADEDKVLKLREFTLEMPNTQNGKNRPVDVAFYFGGTEVTVEAVNREEAKSMKTTVDFAWTYNEIIDE